MVMLVPNQAINVVDIDGVGESGEINKMNLNEC